MWYLIKNWKTLLGGAIIFALLSGTIYLQQKRIENLKDDRDRQKENVINLLEDNSSLKLTSKELQNYIKNSESKFAKEIDSVTSLYNIKIKNLNKVIQSKTEVVIRDTIFSPPTVIEKLPDSLYVLTFSMEKNCVSAIVEARTKDEFTHIKFTEIKANNESYFVVYKEPKKWWQLFKKRKLMQKTVNSCGETIIKEIEITKN